LPSAKAISGNAKIGEKLPNLPNSLLTSSSSLYYKYKSLYVLYVYVFFYYVFVCICIYFIVIIEEEVRIERREWEISQKKKLGKSRVEVSKIVCKCPQIG